MPSLDPWTVVSVAPHEIDGSKPQVVAEVCDHEGKNTGLYLPAVEKGQFAALQILSWTRPYYVDYERGVVRMNEPPEDLANSIANDHIRSSLYVTNGANPGVFALHGALDKDTIARGHKTALERAMREQIAWMNRILKAADDAWQRFRQHRMLSDIHVTAAKWLGVKREWAEDAVSAANVQCQFCTSLISAKAVVCPICRLPQQANLASLPEAVRQILGIGQPPAKGA